MTSKIVLVSTRLHTDLTDHAASATTRAAIIAQARSTLATALQDAGIVEAEKITLRNKSTKLTGRVTATITLPYEQVSEYLGDKRNYDTAS